MDTEYRAGVPGIGTAVDVERRMTILLATPRRRAMVRALILFLLAGLVSYSFRQGWRRAGTDFPNYYTAAVLVVQRQRLRNFYDWPWFQRQMNYAGVEQQLGGYIPQTPLTMLPIMPLAPMAVQAAKRTWLVVNLFFIAGALVFLARISGFSLIYVVLIALTGYGSLHENLLLGQYYIFLLLVISAAFYCLQNGQPGKSGWLLGLAFMLKLYGGPFVLYFAVKRQWRAVVGVALACLLMGTLAIALFGWSDIAYYLAAILPRSLRGETLDPFNPANGTIFTLLRRMLMYEPESNPHTLFTAPALFLFLQPLLGMTIIIIPLFTLNRCNPETGFAALMIASLLASPNTASYTFVLLLLPVTLLMMYSTMVQRILLLLLYGLVALPMRPSWNWPFPKVWLLAVLLYVAIMRARRPWFPWKPAFATTTLVVAVATLSAWRSLAAYDEEPGRHWPRIATTRGAIYSSAPTSLRSGIVYESIDAGRYTMRWQLGSENRTFLLSGEIFHPVALSPEGPIQFELVSHGSSQVCSVQIPVTTELQCHSGGKAIQNAAISPDGNWIVAVRQSEGTKQIWMSPAAESRFVKLTGGNCNSFAPAWEWDSKAIVFASDCGRGIGLPALYRATIASIFQLSMRVRR